MDIFDPNGILAQGFVLNLYGVQVQVEILGPNGVLVQGFILVTGIIGQLYVSHMNARGFYWWLASNTALIVVNAHFGSYGAAGLYGYFSAMAVYSIYKWKRLQSAAAPN